MEEITLTREIADDVIATLCKHQEICKDPLISAQYLTAIVGYIVASTTPQGMDGQEIASDMAGFLQHVYSDLTSNEQAAQAAPPPPPQADPDAAFGIWKPKK